MAIYYRLSVLLLYIDEFSCHYFDREFYTLFEDFYILSDMVYDTIYGLHTLQYGL